MISLYSLSSEVRVGDIHRYTIKAKRSCPYKSIHCKVKNTKNITFRASLLPGPFIIYADIRPASYDHNKKTDNEPIYDPDLKANQSLKTDLNVNEENIWIIEVVSQMIFGNLVTTPYKITITTNPLNEMQSLSSGNSHSSDSLSSNSELASHLEVIREDTKDLWKIPPPIPDKPIHLAILTHGIESNTTADLFYLKEQIQAHTKENVMIRGVIKNAGKTEKGIRYLGKRLALYVLEQVHENPGINKISFIGHSLGGLVQTFALGYIQEHDHTFFQRIKPINFITMASPLLGISNEGPLYVNLILTLGLLGKTGLDLCLMPTFPHKLPGLSKPTRTPIVKYLPYSPAMDVMKLFENRTVYANAVNDGIVPLRTSALLYLDWEGLGAVDLARKDKLNKMKNNKRGDNDNNNPNSNLNSEDGSDNNERKPQTEESPKNSTDNNDSDTKDTQTDKSLKEISFAINENSNKNLTNQSEHEDNMRSSSSNSSYNTIDYDTTKRDYIKSRSENNILDTINSSNENNDTYHGRQINTLPNEPRPLSVQQIPLSKPSREVAIVKTADIMCIPQRFQDMFTFLIPAKHDNHKPKHHGHRSKVKSIYKFSQTKSKEKDHKNSNSNSRSLTGSSNGTNTTTGSSSDNEGDGNKESVPETLLRHIPEPASAFVSATHLLSPPLPSKEYITNPDSRTSVIMHDQFYDESDLPPRRRTTSRSGLGTFTFMKRNRPQTTSGGEIKEQMKSPKLGPPRTQSEEEYDLGHLEEILARKWHEGMRWRKVLVGLDPEAHNNIVVRRRFVNAGGWEVVDHLVSQHF